jgi:hypothetical protein
MSASSSSMSSSLPCSIPSRINSHFQRRGTLIPDLKDHPVGAHERRPFIRLPCLTDAKRAHYDTIYPYQAEFAIMAPSSSAESKSASPNGSLRDVFPPTSVVQS